MKSAKRTGGFAKLQCKVAAFLGRYGHFVCFKRRNKRVLRPSYQRSFSGIDRKPASISLIFSSVSVSPLAALNVAHIDCSAWSVIDRTKSIGMRVLLKCFGANPVQMRRCLCLPDPRVL